MFNLIFFCCLLSFRTSSHFILAITPEQKAEVRNYFMNITKICAEDYILTEDDLVNLKGRKMPTGPNAPCFLACLMKHSGVMDDNGTVRKDIDIEKAKPILYDPDRVKITQGYLETCSYVKSEPVGAGEKGCEMAYLLYKCTTENGLEMVTAQVGHLS